MAKLSLTVAIPTYNRDSKTVIPTLRTVSEQRRKPDRIVVLDQGPGIELEHELRGQFPLVEYIFHEPPSLPAARNRALSECDTDIVLFCDDDVRASPDWAGAHLEEYTDSSVGGVAGRVLEGENQKQVPPGAPVGRFYLAGARAWKNFHSEHRSEVDTLYGCNMSFRVEALKKVGGFSTLFGGTAHLEETDVSLRLKKAGWKLIFAPKAELRHLKLSSGGCRHLGKHDWIYWLCRNHVLLHRRHFPRRQRPVFIAEKLLWLFWTSGRALSIKPLIKGIRGAFAGFRTPSEG